MKYLFLSLLVSCLSLAQDNRIKIAIIDTGITPGELLPYLCQEGHKDFTNTGLNDNKGHGTMVAALIAQNINPSRTCLLIIKYYENKFFSWPTNRLTAITNALKYAIEQHVKYINISSSGEDPYENERLAIQQALKEHIRIAVAAGNSHQNLSKNCNSFPACYPIHDYNFFVVGSLNENGSRLSFSNYNGPVNQYELGASVCTSLLTQDKCATGTSMSTALFLGKLVKKETR